MKPRVDLFQRTAKAVAATTFSFEPSVFQDLFLPRLDRAVPVTVVADAGCLRQTFNRLAEHSPDRLNGPNRRYLVRGVERFPYAFHPKTILAVLTDEVRLAIGSGNLTMGGLLEGREFSSVLTSATPDGAQGIRDWFSWFSSIVDRLDDDRLARRRDELEPLLPEATPGVHSPFVSNSAAPLIEQFYAGLPPGPPDHLVVLSPFYDSDIRQLIRTIQHLAPRRVSVYACQDARVDGALLRTMRDDAHGTIELLRPLPPRFVHAKAVAAVFGERAWLLSGSPNCTEAALGLHGTVGNVECGTLIEAPAPMIRTLLLTGMDSVPLTDDDLQAMRWEDEEKVEQEPREAMSLIGAEQLMDGRIEVSYRGAPGSHHLLGLQQGRVGPLVIDHQGPPTVARTPSRVDGVEFRAVAICNPEGRRLSAWWPVDDPRALAAEAGAYSDEAHVPPGMWASDLDSDAGKLLLYIDGTVDYAVLFSPTSTPPVLDDESEEAAEVPNPSQEHGDDIRIPWRPRHLGRSTGGPTLSAIDDVLRELAALRDRLPPATRIAGGPVAGVISSEDDESLTDESLGDDSAAADEEPTVPAQAPIVEATPAESGHRQAARRRRFANAITRRCLAAGSRRLFEEDTSEAIDLLGRLINVLHDLATNTARRELLNSQQLVRLTGTLLDAVVGEPTHPGLFGLLSDDDRQAVVAALGRDLIDRLTSLVLSLAASRQRGDLQQQWRERIAYGLELGLLNTDNPSLAEQLLWAATYIDDKHWPEVATRDCRIPVANLTREGARIFLELRLPSEASLFDDPRVTSVLDMWYRTQPDLVTESLALVVADDPENRIAVSRGLGFAKHDDVALPHPAILSRRIVAQLAADHKPLSLGLFTVEDGEASAG